MNKKIFIVLQILATLACTDDIDKSNRYTFTGETVADFMLNRSDRYSHMITLMERAGLLHTDAKNYNNCTSDGRRELVTF